MPNGVGQCGIGSSMNAQGQCIGTYSGMDGIAHVASGVNPSPVVAGVVGIGGSIVAVLFASFAVMVVAKVLRRRRAQRLAQEKREWSASRKLYRDYYKNFDMAEFGQRLHEAGYESDAEDDTEDDSPNDDAEFAEERP